MIGVEMSQPVSVRNRLRIWLASFVAVAGMCVTATMGPVQSASAVEPGSHYFCTGWLGPWQGFYNGRCDAPDSVSGYGLMRVSVFTGERAGCVTYGDVWHELKKNWSCTSNHSQKDMYIPNDGGWYRGIIRNNNTNYGGFFDGNVLCCSP